MEEGSEELLSGPVKGSESFQKTHTRSGCSYTNHCGDYLLRERDYVTQYAHIYFNRLDTMRPHLEKAAARKWGGLARFPSQNPDAPFSGQGRRVSVVMLCR